MVLEGNVGNVCRRGAFAARHQPPRHMAMAARGARAAATVRANVIVSGLNPQDLVGYVDDDGEVTFGLINVPQSFTRSLEHSQRVKESLTATRPRLHFAT